MNLIYLIYKFRTKHRIRLHYYIVLTIAKRGSVYTSTFLHLYLIWVIGKKYLVTHIEIFFCKYFWCWTDSFCFSQKQLQMSIFCALCHLGLLSRVDELKILNSQRNPSWPFINVFGSRSFIFWLLQKRFLWMKPKPLLKNGWLTNMSFFLDPQETLKFFRTQGVSKREDLMKIQKVIFHIHGKNLSLKKSSTLCNTRG